MQGALDEARDKASSLEKELEYANSALESSEKYLRYLQENKHQWWQTPLTFLSFALDAILVIAIGKIYLAMITAI